MFHRALHGGGLLGPAAPTEMRTTVPIVTGGGGRVDYGLGIYATTLPCGRARGGGDAWGMTTRSLSTQDERRQISYGVNRTKYHRLDENGVPQPHPIDTAIDAHTRLALRGMARRGGFPGWRLVRWLGRPMSRMVRS